MKTISIPYFTGCKELHVEEKNLKAVLHARTDEYQCDLSEEDLIRQALEHPVGTPRLSELAEGKNKVVLITSDHTRGVPSRLTLPILLAEIRKGNPAADITILIATGLHRETTREEQRRMFGDEIVEHEKIAVNNAFRDEDFEHVCTLPSGAELWLNRLARSCDLLVTEGFIEPHFFAGFSGGRKSILPGICNAATVNENHSYKAVASPFANAGILKNNPIHEDMVYAARQAGVAFILNVALNSRKKVIGAFAGDLEEAHERGVAFVRKLAQSPAVTGDIVITSNNGYPLDQNLYQSPKSAATAEVCCREGGVIILVASCCDGVGGSHFEKLMLLGTQDEIDEYLSRIPPRESIPEQWCAQIFARILKKHTIILVSDLEPELVKRMNMIPADSPDAALQMAYELVGAEAQVVAIPDGVAVLAVAEADGKTCVKEQQGGAPEKKTALKVDDLDNVATVFANGIEKGTAVTVRDKKGCVEDLTVLDAVPYGHKIALRNIEKGEHIVKYGESIGAASELIPKGAWVHVHNMEALRGRGDL